MPGYLYDPQKGTIEYKDQTIQFYCGAVLNDIAVILLDLHFGITGLQETLIRLLIDTDQPPSFEDFTNKILKKVAEVHEIPESLLRQESEQDIERAVIHPPELRSAIDSLLCKVNRVTSSHRHGLSVTEADLTALCDKQLETEEAFRKAGLL